MSLGNLGNNLNSKGGDLYAQQKARIMREAEEHKMRLEQQEADRAKQDISHKKLQKQTLEGRIQQLRNDINRVSHNSSDRTFRSVVSEKERELRSLEVEKRRLEGDILSLEGKTHAAHNVHFNNPHYF